MCIFQIFLIGFCHKSIEFSIPLSTSPNSLETLDDVSQENNKTTEKNPLEERETQPIKRVDVEHQHIGQEYPILSKQEPQFDLDKIPLDQLKLKCQQLSRLFGIDNKTSQTTSSRPGNHRYPDVQARPVFYPTRPTFRPIRYPQTSKPQGFYVTSSTPTTKRPAITNEQPTTPIKYIRLEPVILQKTILGDGRTVYLWHKSLPTAVEYPTNQTPFVPNAGQSASQSDFDYNTDGKLVYSPQYGYYYNPRQQIYASNYLQHGQTSATNVNAQHITTESTTTTTTEDSNSYGYGLSNFIPFYR